jgi:hypothetical protein
LDLARHSIVSHLISPIARRRPAPPSRHGANRSHENRIEASSCRDSETASIAEQAMDMQVDDIPHGALRVSFRQPLDLSKAAKFEPALDK